MVSHRGGEPVLPLQKLDPRGRLDRALDDALDDGRPSLDGRGSSEKRLSSLPRTFQEKERQEARERSPRELERRRSSSVPSKKPLASILKTAAGVVMEKVAGTQKRHVEISMESPARQSPEEIRTPDSDQTVFMADQYTVPILSLIHI